MRDENKGPKNEFIETLEVFGRIFNVFRRYIFLSLLPAIAIMLLAHLIFENPTSEDADELIHYAKLADNEKAVLEQRKIKLDIQPLNIKYNREYIIAYLDKYRTGQQHREKLHELLEFYTLKQSATNIFKYDLSNYCLGFIYSNEKKYPKAIEHYIKVKDPDFDYLNNSFGFSYIQEQDFDKAEFYLEKSISISNNLDAAYSNLAKAYFRSKQYDKIRPTSR